MVTKRYLRSVFNIIEHLVHIELSDPSRGIVENYIDSAAATNMAEKARYAIYRYTQIELPSLEDIQKKNREEELSEMDHLILKMEYEAKQADQKR